jgi:hypothetical protein
VKKIGSYEKELNNISPRKWDDFLIEYSGAPDSLNEELAEAFARTGTLMDFKRYAQMGPEEAPEGSPEAFLVFCGILGIGQYLVGKHDGNLLMMMKKLADDPRKECQKGVKLALQNIGKHNMSRLIRYMSSWIEGTLLQRNAAIVGLCVPESLKRPVVVMEVLELLEWGTVSLVEYDNRQLTEEYNILKEGLEMCWSIAVAALPSKGKPVMERWIKEDHPVIRQVMRANLRKPLLWKVDEKWAKYWLERVSI